MSKKLIGMLLLGPTGVGKSPLGDLLEEKGLYGIPMLHFDFGSELRAIARGETRDGILPSERIFIQKVLEEGLLLEDQHFYLAIKILNAFLHLKSAKGTEILVMNGLPRHLGQAKSLEEIIHFPVIVVLEASFEEILERIHRDIGGDRKGRTDDYIELIYKKWLIYRDRTRPLIEFYRMKGAKIIKLLVGRTTTPLETYQSLRSLLSSEFINRVVRYEI